MHFCIDILKMNILFLNVPVNPATFRDFPTSLTRWTLLQNPVQKQLVAPCCLSLKDSGDYFVKGFCGMFLTVYDMHYDRLAFFEVPFIYLFINQIYIAACFTKIA